MCAQIDINDLYKYIDFFLKTAPKKIAEAFWVDYKKTKEEVLTNKNLLKEKEFLNDWYYVMLYVKEGANVMEEKKIRTLLEDCVKEHYSKEIQEKIQLVDKYWNEEEKETISLSYDSSVSGRYEFLCQR